MTGFRTSDQNMALWHRLDGDGHPPLGWNEDHNDHLVTRAMHVIAEALSEGADHDAHVFHRLAYLASLPRPECVIPGLVVTTADLRAERTTTELLALIGVRHEPHPQHGCRMLYAGDVALGPMHVGEAYALLCRAESAA